MIAQNNETRSLMAAANVTMNAAPMEETYYNADERIEALAAMVAALDKEKTELNSTDCLSLITLVNNQFIFSLLKAHSYREVPAE